MKEKSRGNNKLTVITTHNNADFDGISSMFVAQKLYPGAIVVFQGAYEKSVKDFFIKSMAYLLNISNIKDINPGNIERIVIVDTKQPERIGALAQLVKKKNIEIHIYDHHPKEPTDIKGDAEFIEKTGSTTSILIRRIIEKKIQLTPEEATVACLGIYEDTGSFSFSSTTPMDFDAASYLVSCGASVETVSQIISKEMTHGEIIFLNELLNNAETRRINGVDIVFTRISSDNYISGFSAIVNRMMKMENISTVFALCRMGNKVYIIAKSRTPEVDCREIMIFFGGQGHAYAASASLKNEPLTQIETKLIDILKQKVRTENTAKDLMTSPAIQINEDATISDAGRLMTRYNINAVLVKSDRADFHGISGYISRQVVEKALYHRLNDSRVNEFTTPTQGTVSPDTDLSLIKEQIIDNKQRIIPVIEEGKIKGVITRTDILNFFVQKTHLNTGKFPDPLKKPFYSRTKNVLHFIKERLPESIIQLLRKIGKVADEMDYVAYVVGGFVRDLMLYKKNLDIDIVIEGNGIEFAKAFAKKEKIRINTYEKFGTAVMIFPDGFKIDVATARMEYYKHPAALPEVETSSIKLDLYRRDFTINTLAIKIESNGFGTLIDFFAAQRDLKDKAIRVIHNLSFVEDPTRVFRAVKFEQRFGFTIGKLTESLIKNAVKMNYFKNLIGFRIFSEIKQILQEENPVPAVIRMGEFDLLKIIHPSILADKNTIWLLDSVKKTIAWHELLFTGEQYEKWVIYFLVLIRKLDLKETEMLCGKLMIPPSYANVFGKERLRSSETIAFLSKNKKMTHADLYNTLTIHKTEHLLFMMGITSDENVKKQISNFHTKLKHIKISVMGRDLIKEGLKPGPHFKKILDKIHNAKLNNLIKTKEDEYKLLKKLSKKNPV